MKVIIYYSCLQSREEEALLQMTWLLSPGNDNASSQSTGERSRELLSLSFPSLVSFEQLSSQ